MENVRVARSRKFKIGQIYSNKKAIKAKSLKNLFSDKEYQKDQMTTLDNVTLAAKLIYKISSQNVEKLFEST